MEVNENCANPLGCSTSGPMREYIAIQAYHKKKKKNKKTKKTRKISSKLMLQIKKLEKEQQMKPKASISSKS